MDNFRGGIETTPRSSSSTDPFTVPVLVRLTAQRSKDDSFRQRFLNMLTGGNCWRRMKPRRAVAQLTVLAFVILSLRSMRSQEWFNGVQELWPAPLPPLPDPPPLSTPRKFLSLSDHPIVRLVETAEREFQEMRARQSQSLDDAVREYRRRYKIPPPPNFDKWYEFATKNGVQLIDEYDTIYHSILPFWGLKPSTIRSRAREALGYENELIGMTIRQGKCVLIQHGVPWQQEASVGMMRKFMAHLPDMDLAFNPTDEPRVVIPHDDLERLVSKAKETTIPAAMAAEDLTNAFSKRPADLNDGKSFVRVETTKFGRGRSQPTWLTSRLSCPPDSPARMLDEPREDDTAAYALKELGFIYNTTAFSDICLTPSLETSLGFFAKANSYSATHELYPIFSQSKVSSYQDILYPSPWYWQGKVAYDPRQDIAWEEKADDLYWRGSTTGGLSEDGGWRRQHRQQVVRRINAPDRAQILMNVGSQSEPRWEIQDVPRGDYAHLFDVKFSHVGQCEEHDCEAMREFFKVVQPAGQQAAWASKYLLDMDGNAFSGRFHAFMRSNSLIYKLALFREWHEDWLKPWVHYVPLGLQGDEYVESVRYFSTERDGQARARRLAMQGKEWADRTLRREDLEVWLFRLLLEYVMPLPSPLAPPRAANGPSFLFSAGRDG